MHRVIDYLICDKKIGLKWRYSLKFMNFLWVDACMSPCGTVCTCHVAHYAGAMWRMCGTRGMYYSAHP